MSHSRARHALGTGSPLDGGSSMKSLYATAVRHAADRSREEIRDSDVRVASGVLDSMIRGRLVLFAQPVFDRDCKHVLYHECLVRMLGENGQVGEGPSTFVPSLERAGLIRFLDRYVIGLVIEHLEANPDLCLGANISAQSTRDVVWWESLLSKLVDRPDIARRLIVEITETTQLSRSSGNAFVDCLQRTGCRIAIDDLGDGYSIDNCRYVPSIDIVKISGKMLPRSPQWRVAESDQFRQLLAVARTIAPCIVVEGVETENDLFLAQSAGAHGVQGYFGGKPYPLSRNNESACTSDEKAPAQFERVMSVLLEESLDVELRDAARTACAAGFASVVYGKDSAIATRPIEQTLEDRRKIGIRSDEHFQLIRLFYLFGRRNGRSLTRAAHWRANAQSDHPDRAIKNRMPL
ncbi:EAL domain-containing protein [Burkholderia ambifaria]